MKISTVLLLLAMAHTNCLLSAQMSGVPEIQFRSVPDFLHLPDTLYFGEVTGVAVNSKGHIFRILSGQYYWAGVWCRSGAATRIRPGWQISARDWPQPLCMVLCTHRQG
jgi:hypothetical protein